MLINDPMSDWNWFMYDQSVTSAQYPLANHEATTNAALGLCPLTKRVLLHRVIASNSTATACGIRKGDGSVYITGNTPVLASTVVDGTRDGSALNLVLDQGMGIVPGAGTGLVIVVYRILSP